MAGAVCGFCALSGLRVPSAVGDLEQQVDLAWGSPPRPLPSPQAPRIETVNTRSSLLSGVSQDGTLNL